MKKLFFIAAAMCLAIAGCKEPEVEVQYDPISMTEFGFLAEDNAALNADFKTAVETSEINISLPYGVSEDDVKALVPVFVLSDETAVAKVGDKEVVSGETALDFSAPVDIVISTEHVNAMYTVTVMVQKPLAFVKVAESEFAANTVTMTISPKDNLPYFIATSSNSDSKLRYAHVLKLNGASVDLYYKNALIEAGASYPDIAVDPEGNTYVSFYDAVKAARTVMAVTPNAANLVGEQGAIVKETTSCGAALLANSANEIWSMTANNKAGAVVGKRGLNIAKYDGAAWTQEISCGTRALTAYSYDIVAKTIGGVNYLMVVDYQTVNLSLYKYDAVSKAWVDYPGAILPEENKPITTADYSNGAIDFDVASNGDVYIAASADFFTPGTKECGVIKLNPVTKEITMLGGGKAFEFAHKDCRYLRLALDANDVPYVVLGNTFRNTETTVGETTTKVYDPAVITYLDADTKVWTPAQPISEPVHLSDLSIAFADNGVGYVSYLNEENAHVVVYQTVNE